MRLLTEGDVKAASLYLLALKLSQQEPDLEKIESYGRNVRVKKVVLESGVAYLVPYNENGSPYLSEPCRGCSRQHSEEGGLNVDILDLGDGLEFRKFGLNMLKGNRNAGSLVLKKFRKGDIVGKVDYLVVPPDQDGNSGLFDFTYTLEERQQAGPSIRRLGSPLPGVEIAALASGGESLKRVVQVDIKTEDMEEPSFVCKSRVRLGFVENDSVEVVQFDFNSDGSLYKIGGVSTGEVSHGCFEGDVMGRIVKRNVGEPFSYSPQDREARILSKAVFGRDVAPLTHDMATSIKRFMLAARTESLTDPLQLLAFESL